VTSVPPAPATTSPVLTPILADVFLDPAAVALEDLLHPLEVAREQRPQRLRVDGLAKRRRAGDVAEDDGDRLPHLALGLERGGALRAEPRADLVLAAAPLTDHRSSLGRQNAAVSDTNQDLRLALERADAREAAVRDVIQTIARTTFDLDAVLQTVVDRAVELCRADNGNIARRDGDVYRVVAFTSFTGDFERLVRERDYVPERASVIGRTLLERQVVQIVDVLEDPEYALTDIQRAGGYRTLLGVPMLREGEPIGSIVLGRREVRPFDEAEIRLIETFADYVVIAIENVRLFQTVERQRIELARFAPHVAELLSSDAGEQLIAGHRREISALFCDLRGFTAFAETADPEDVLGVLRQYHTAVGELVVANEGTVEHFAGDGLMAFFNDPVEIPDHELAAARTAVAMGERFSGLASEWSKRGHDLGLGIGIATGFATLGRIGFEGRYDYGAVGNAVILAARLSDAAGPGEILLSRRTFAAIDDHVVGESVDELRLKGFSRPVAAMRLVALRA
jgi:adenylate cyclase